MMMDRWQYENYMEDIERKIKKQINNQRVTNADRIRSMTDEELAKGLVDLLDVGEACAFCLPVMRKPLKCDGHCISGVLKWLKTETR